MKRLVLLVVFAAAAAGCGGGAAPTESLGSGQARELAAPEVEAGPTTTLPPLERIVLGEQLPDLKMPPPGTVHDPSSRLNDTGICGRYFRMMLDDTFWASGSDAERFETIIAQLDHPQGADLAARFAVAIDDAGPDSWASAWEGLEALTLRDCGQPGAGAYFLVSSTPGEPHLLPCLLATGADWADLATGSDLPWHPVDCATGELVAWDADTGAWGSAESAAEQRFREVDEALG